MGTLPGYSQVTLYLEPTLYEEVRCAAYSLGLDVYEFVGEVLADGLDSRLDKEQRATVAMMAKQNLKNVKGGARRKASLRRKSPPRRTPLT